LHLQWHKVNNPGHPLQRTENQCVLGTCLNRHALQNWHVQNVMRITCM
jgi:hypothetical protein